VKQPPPGLPPASSAKWHSRRWSDALGYLRVRSLANPEWQRDIPWLVRWLRRESPPTGDPLRGHYDAAITAARRYQHLLDRGGVGADLDAAWDDVLAPIDAVLEHRSRVHQDRVRHGRVSGDDVPGPTGVAGMGDGDQRLDHPGLAGQPDQADPWGSYTKGKLPAGWAYPLGRDAVRQALLSAGAFVGHLYFSAPSRSYRDGEAAWTLLGVRHSSDAKGGYFTPQGFQTPSLWMTLGAVPAARRAAICAELSARWLPQASEWAARAPNLGNAWSAQDHSWRVTIDAEGDTELVED